MYLPLYGYSNCFHSTTHWLEQFTSWSPEPFLNSIVPSCNTFNCTRSFAHPHRPLRVSYVDELPFINTPPYSPSSPLIIAFITSSQSLRRHSPYSLTLVLLGNPGRCEIAEDTVAQVALGVIRGRERPALLRVGMRPETCLGRVGPHTTGPA